MIIEEILDLLAIEIPEVVTAYRQQLAGSLKEEITPGLFFKINPSDGSILANSSLFFWACATLFGRLLLKDLLSNKPYLYLFIKKEQLCTLRPKDVSLGALTSALYWLSSYAHGREILDTRFRKSIDLASNLPPDSLDTLRPSSAGAYENTCALTWLSDDNVSNRCLADEMEPEVVIIGKKPIKEDLPKSLQESYEKALNYHKTAEAGAYIGPDILAYLHTQNNRLLSNICFASLFALRPKKALFYADRCIFYSISQSNTLFKLFNSIEKGSAWYGELARPAFYIRRNEKTAGSEAHTSILYYSCQSPEQIAFLADAFNAFSKEQRIAFITELHKPFPLGLLNADDNPLGCSAFNKNLTDFLTSLVKNDSPGASEANGLLQKINSFTASLNTPRKKPRRSDENTPPVTCEEEEYQSLRHKR